MAASLNDALTQIASHGILGALLVVSLIALYMKDKRLNEETAARLKDGQDTQKLLLQVQQNIIDAVHKLGEIVEWAEKRADEIIRDRGRR